MLWGTRQLLLEYGGRAHPIHKTPFVLGRSRDCDLVLYGDAVSRRHAAIGELRGELFVEDLGSRNGVLVNARRVRGRARLRPGDVLMLGDEPISVLADSDVQTVKPEATPRPALGTTPRPAVPLEPTEPVEVFDLFTSAVDKALLSGRIADAERLFALHIGRPLEHGPLTQDADARVIETVSLVALRLAEAARNDAWIDFTIRVYSRRNLAMPVSVVAGLSSLVAKLRGIDAKLLDAYVSTMTARGRRLSPEEQSSLDRLRGLETVARCSRRSRRPPAPRAES